MNRRMMVAAGSMLLAAKALPVHAQSATPAVCGGAIGRVVPNGAEMHGTGATVSQAVPLKEGLIIATATMGAAGHIALKNAAGSSVALCNTALRTAHLYRAGQARRRLRPGHFPSHCDCRRADRAREPGALKERTMPTTKALFPLGHIVATPAALAALEAAGELPAAYLNRHLTGDWGDVDPAGWKANDRAVRARDRLLSAYTLGSGETLWIITEGNRSATTLLLPADD